MEANIEISVTHQADFEQTLVLLDEFFNDSSFIDAFFDYVYDEQESPVSLTSFKFNWVSD